MRKLSNTWIIVLLLLFFLSSCRKKYQVKIIAKDFAGNPLINRTCGVHDDEYGSGNPLVSAQTNNSGEALLEFTVKKNHAIIIWCGGANCSPGNWTGDARDAPKEWEFKCQ